MSTLQLPPKKILSLPSRERSRLPGLSNLDKLEAEAIHILWEAHATLSPVALMFSGGKDSAVVAHLVKRAFSNSPSRLKIPFTFIHYDSGANFREVLDFRDRTVAELGAELYVYHVATSKNRQESAGSIKALIAQINRSVVELRLQGLIGGGRRDEELVRAKERIFSRRDKKGLWNPHDQRPEPWGFYNAQLNRGEHLRIFPLSNWTERNVWEYIAREKIALPSIYYAHQRKVLKRNGSWIAVFNDCEVRQGEKIEFRRVRCRTAGDLNTTGFVESAATTPHEVLAELQLTRFSERAGRAEDHGNGVDMETRKRLGWP